MVELMTEWTDKSWRHVRIDRVSGRGRYAVRTWYLATAFGPVSKAFLGVPDDVNLERLSLADARTWGAKIEARLSEPGERRHEREVAESAKAPRTDWLF